MSDFRINPGMEYYVIIHPTIDRSRAVAVTTMGDNILIQGGLVQFGMKDIRIVKNDADGIANSSLMRRN